MIRILAVLILFILIFAAAFGYLWAIIWPLEKPEPKTETQPYKAYCLRCEIEMPVVLSENIYSCGSCGLMH